MADYGIQAIYCPHGVPARGLLLCLKGQQRQSTQDGFKIPDFQEIPNLKPAVNLPKRLGNLAKGTVVVPLTAISFTITGN